MSRVVNRLGALILAAALAAAGALVFVEALWTWTGNGFVGIPGHQWLRSLETTMWSAGGVVGVSVGVAIVGLVLLVAELRPQRRGVAPYETERDTWLLSRRSVEGHLARRLQAAVPTSPIRASLYPKGRWRLRIVARAANSTRPDLEAAARIELARLHASRARLQIKTTGATKS